TLPSNPNGYFVISKDPNADYLVETNPLFNVGVDFVGSQYMEHRYGYDPDDTIQKLGDANYEGYLIRQQLISKIGSNLLGGFANEAAQMQSLMDAGLSSAKKIGFEYGKAPKKDQIDKLKEDIVWMVETVVDGKKVLTPVVYLAKSTKDAIEKGAVIAAKDVNMNLASVTNTGGTISGDNTLNIKSKGDITNTSGTIKGGDVSLKSTEGSIISKTYTQVSGGDLEKRTSVGKTAEIKSTKNLNIDAAKNIKNIGAQMKAGKNASLKAGGDVTFDTIKKETTKTTHTKKTEFMNDAALLGGSSITKTEQKTEHIKSGLTVGGNLNIKSGKDITLAGTDVKTKGNADFEAKKDINILARNNETKTLTKTRTTGFGVGGGVFGVENETKDQYQSKNLASNINIGGDATIKSGNTLKIKGSEVDIAGSAKIDAKDVKIIEGRNIDKTHTKTTTVTFTKIDSGSEKSKTKTKTGSKAGLSGAKAEAETGASYEGKGGLVVAGVTNETSDEYSSKSVGSSLKVGKNLTVNTENEALIRGSKVEAKGDVDLNAKNVKVMAAEDIHTSTVTTNTTNVGFMGETENEAKAKAKANAQFGATADASAKATSDNSLYLASNTKTTKGSKDITHTGSSIKSGGNLKIDAKEKLTVKGSELSGDKKVELKAKDMEFLAAQDEHTTTYDTQTVNAGFYNDNKAEAFAGAKQGMRGAQDNRAAAGVKGKAGAGLKAEVLQSSGGVTKTKAVVSSIKSGSGSITRTAENSIKDVGTNIEAAQDFTQSAKTIESLAAKDTTTIHNKSQTDTGKMGGYLEGEVSGGYYGKSGTSSTAAVGKGAEASYSREEEKDSSYTSKAVVSNIKAGGKVTSVSTDKTTFEGTKIAGAGGVEIEAGELDFKAVKDIEKSNKSSFEAGGSVNVGKTYGKKAPISGGVAGNYGEESKTKDSYKAVTGSITSGAGISIKTKNDAKFEGTAIKSSGNTEINAGGNVKFDAAKSYTSEKEKSQNIEASVGKNRLAKKGESILEASAKGGYGISNTEKTTFEAGSIESGGKININSGKSATFTGTEMEAKKDVTINAKDNVKFNAAIDTSESTSHKLDAGVSVYGKSKAGKKENYNALTADQSASYKKSKKAVTGNIKSGSNINITGGGDIGFEGTDVKAEKKVLVAAGGTVTSKSVESSSLKLGESISLSVSADSQSKKGGSSSAAAGVDIEADFASSKKKTNIKGGDVQIVQNSKAAQAAAIVQNPAAIQGAVTGSPVDMKNFSPETKTEFAKQAMANALGIDPSEVDTSSSKFAELNKKLKEAKSINGTGANSFDLKGFCETLGN
ncbi:MAG: hemagglutinin repeat-containing protein, partial [Deltaproteobacteria bacterium]|nr:hemagglutinin repeat-containing protein [Deltaproteobacteria bacterium]